MAIETFLRLKIFKCFYTSCHAHASTTSSIFFEDLFVSNSISSDELGFPSHSFFGIASIVDLFYTDTFHSFIEWHIQCLSITCNISSTTFKMPLFSTNHAKSKMMLKDLFQPFIHMNDFKINFGLLYCPILAPSRFGFSISLFLGSHRLSGVG